MTKLAVQDFDTDRLSVRSWRQVLNPSDFEPLCAQLERILVPQVLEHLPPSMALGPGADATADWVRARDAEAQVMLVRNRQEDLIGVLILAAPDGDQGEMHLGYMLAPDAWGAGFGTELVTGLVQSVVSSASVGALIGGVAGDNPASARVLEKAGFARMAEGGHPETVFYRFALPKG